MGRASTLTTAERRAAKRKAQGFIDDPAKQDEAGGQFVQRTSFRWIGRRTKGLPFSKCLLADMTPAPKPGTPATLTLKHPTKGRVHRLHATPALVELFYPGINANPLLYSALLGN